MQSVLDITFSIAEHRIVRSAPEKHRKKMLQLTREVLVFGLEQMFINPKGMAILYKRFFSQFQMNDIFKSSQSGIEGCTTNVIIIPLLQ